MARAAIAEPHADEKLADQAASVETFPLSALIVERAAALSQSKQSSTDAVALAHQDAMADQWLVVLSSDADPHQLAALSPDAQICRAEQLPGAYLVQFADARSVDSFSASLSVLDGVDAVYPLQERQQSLRFVPNDPLFANQWHLLNSGQSGGTQGADARVTAAWDSVRGAGVVIGIVDDGLQYTHPDLSAQYLAAASYDFNFNDPNPYPDFAEEHGTAVAGVAAGRGNNGLGISGAAPSAQLAGLRLLAAATTDAQEAAALSHASDSIDIYSNSWGPFDDAARLEGPGPLTLAALANGVANGRDGLGNIYVWAAGNGLGSDDNVNYDGYANSRYTIAVGAIDHNGVQSYYSEPGASMLVTAYSSGASVGITTTDLVGADGYSTGDYTSGFGGTSSSTPLVSGVVALMLEANPNLTWRDVRAILAETAGQNDPANADWRLNGAGYHINHNYGFGAIDAAAAVSAAAGWTPLAAEQTVTSGTISVGAPIPDLNTTGVSRSFTFTDELRIETVEVVLNATHTYRGDLNIVLTSPDGTRSILAEPHGDSGNNYNNWTFTSVRHWGELSAGTWTLTVSDPVAIDVGTWNSWRINLYGTTAFDPTGPPTVVSHSPEGSVLPPVSVVEFRFREPMNTASFAVSDDIGSFTGPSEDLLPRITGFNWQAANVLRVSFQPQVQRGAYSLALGPNVLAADDDSPLDQDGDGVVGELEDGYAAQFEIAGTGPGEIYGRVFNDLDGDGVFDGDEPPMAGWEVFLDLNANGIRDTAPLTFHSADVPQTIQDQSTVRSELEVTGIPGTLTDIDVQLTISHTYTADLDVFLISPQGTRVELFTDVGGSGNDFIGTTLDDEAPTPIGLGSAPFIGRYRPEGLLSTFDGHDPNGTWTLEIVDDAIVDVGILSAWSLAIAVPEPNMATNGQGQYAFKGLPAGTYHIVEVLSEGWEQTYPDHADATHALHAAITTSASTAPIFPQGTRTNLGAGAKRNTPQQSARTNASGPLIRMDQFRADSRFAGIDGGGYGAVVIDTGIDLDHPFFGPDTDGNGVADRIIFQWDFADGDPDASDFHGHGSNVSSIVGSQDTTYPGMAPGVDLIHLKVFSDSGFGDFGTVEQALQWVVANAAVYNIASVNMSLGDNGNYGSALSLYGLGDELAALAAQNVMVVSAAGNDFYEFASIPGVAYPAADPNSLAVGAVWDGNNGGPFEWSGGAVDVTTAADRLTSFTQRHAILTDVFAPGAMIRGADASGGTVNFAGTSQAAPHIAGIAVLAQQLADRELGRRLSATEFRDLLASSGTSIFDGDDENDNVTNTQTTYRRVDMFALAETILTLGGGTGGPGAGRADHVVELEAEEVVLDVDFGVRLIPPENQPPVLDLIADPPPRDGGRLVSFVVTASDPDLPAQSLTFSLDAPVPFGATIDATSRLFSWVPNATQTPGVYSITVRVTDDGSPARSASQAITVRVLQPGDVDLDDDVDFQDFFVLQAQYGTTTGALRTDGDLTEDGDVDFADFGVLQAYYGTSSPSHVSTAPSRTPSLGDGRVRGSDRLAPASAPNQHAARLVDQAFSDPDADWVRYSLLDYLSRDTRRKELRRPRTELLAAPIA